MGMEAASIGINYQSVIYKGSLYVCTLSTYLSVISRESALTFVAGAFLMMMMIIRGVLLFLRHRDHFMGPLYLS